MLIMTKHIKAFTYTTVVCVLSACTNANVDQTLPTTPSITQTSPIPQAGIAQTGQQIAGNALGSPAVPTPGQNVTEAQIQQQAIQQVQSSSNIGNTNQQVASLTPAVDTSRAITFLPFEGAPQIKTVSLNRFLNSSAQANSLTVFPATRAGAKYKVKGYFSALNDGNGTLLVYVWDITDGTGKRLHRINGRERTGTTRTDPWQAITDAEIQRVAQTTTARIKTWVAKR